MRYSILRHKNGEERFLAGWFCMPFPETSWIYDCDRATKINGLFRALALASKLPKDSAYEIVLRT
jgi:hypothetical protein